MDKLPDISMRAVLPMFPDAYRPCVDTWNEKFENGVLSYTHFKSYWRIWAPKFYSPETNGNPLHWSYDEEKAKEIFFDTLEKFICGKSSPDILQKFNRFENPSSICGRVFKMGEPTYSCRECGMDSTCVLCVECFKRSAHRYHKYKMGTSGGGGCCDCGDTEAWKTEPFCDLHVTNPETSEKTKQQLPQDLLDRARIVFVAILQYAYRLLTLEHSPSLPSDLRIKETEEDPLGLFDSPDVYCTVLFNDEVHTFEHVISTLQKVLKVNQKDSVEYVTNIDREGRAVVKCSTFQVCTELKSEIERITSRHSNKPLKAVVVHAHVVAHQFFAMKLLDWMQNIMSYTESFREIFVDIVTKKSETDSPLIEGILIRDSQLWKAARTQWHRLVITGMLMDYESKKTFAKIFTKHYGSVLKDFIRDDHDHSYSVASLSVQIFTVPTIAHFLIAEQDVLFNLMNTFMSECSRKCNKHGKLEFERNASIITFKRAQYVLYDLRYLLSSKPTEWTDNLRRGFLQGLSLLFNLLYCMQGMDQVTRQVGNHMEYEPEWESAFNLHIKLAQIITLALEWCSSDKIVFVKAYRAVIRKLYENIYADAAQSPQTPEVKELADHSAVCLPYDVSTQPISIHLPLSRFLAGLHLHLENFDFTFRSQELQVNPRPSPEQLIEAVMRTEVMIAQVHAGMWRRNGYSLLNQLFFYHNVKCRPEMLDRDLLLLQIGAALIEANEFLIHLLNKFNLLNWAHPDFEENTLKNPEEDSMRQTISLVEEFLGLLIILIGERHVPGVGKVDSDDQIKKEIIQQLCIKPMAHSELNKALPEDPNHETGMERVIDQLAEFKKPIQGSGKGVYELKPEFYDQYNVFFYHYTREEQSKSEESQRKRRKAAGELDCCPPPVLPPLTQTFMMMSNLLQCDVMLHIMKVVLERSVNLRARSFSEVQLHKILHLIGYALNEEESKQCDYMTFTERAEKWGIEQLIEQLCTSARIESHKDLLTWTLTKYQKVAAPRRQDSETNSYVIVEMPVSNESVVKEEKEWRAKMAAQKREKIMAQMMAMQKNFMKENAKLFENSLTEMQEELSGSAMDLSECVEESPVALGRNQSARANLEKTCTCILCQEDQTVSAGSSALVLSAFVQQSSVLCHSKDYPKSQEEQFDSLFLPSTLGPAPHTSTCGHVMHSQCWQKYFENVLAKESRRPYRVRQPASFDVEKQEFLCPLCQCLSNTILPLIPPLAIIRPTPKQNYDITFESWIEALKIALKYKIKINVDPDVVKRRATPPPPPSLVVQTVPAAPSSPEPQQNENDESSDSSAEENDHDNDNDNDNESAEAMDEETESTNMTQIFYTCPIQQIVVELGEVGEKFVQLFSDSDEGVKLSNNIAEMILLFSQTTYTKALNDANINLKDNRVPLLAWKSCAYTIHALERVLRVQNKPILGDLSCRQQDCLESFVRIVSVFSTVWNQPDMVTSHALRLLHCILENSSEGPTIFDWDSFGFLLPLALSLPSLFLEQRATPIITGNVQDLYVLRLVFLANIVKILLTMDFDQTMVPMDVEDDDIDTGPAVMLDVLNIARTSAGLNKIDANSLWVWLHVKEESIPFLRCCTLFYHFVTNVPAPGCLTQPGGDTFENLCSYLGLPITCEELLDSTVVKELVAKWSSHKKVKMFIPGAAKISIVKPSLPQVSLIDLPEDYSEVINTVSMFSCPNTDYDETRNPTMCLICGQMLCSQSYCCQTEVNKVMIGACTNHVTICGSGVGIFLRVRECEVLLLAAPNRGSFTSPPYLDQYGETDQGLRRGNPLRLCPERFKKLQLLWMSHGIYEEIARSLETNSNHLATQWQHL